MAESNLVQLPPGKPPQKELGDYFLAKRLSEIAEHLNDAARLLYETADQGKAGDLDNLLHGVDSLLAHYASELNHIAESLQPEADKQEGGAE